ncbi:hypothetical protein LXL04_024058 [Taraxacum kok-saghyz]
MRDQVQDDRTRVLYQLCSMIINIVSSPPLPIPFATTFVGATVSSSSLAYLAAVVVHPSSRIVSETVVFLFTTTVTASTPASDEPPLLPTDKPLPPTNHPDVYKPPKKQKQTTGKNRNESEADSEEVVALTDLEWNHRRKLPETARTFRKTQETSSNRRKPPQTAGEISADDKIPLDSIEVFWRKLNLSPAIFVATEEIRCDSALEMFKEDFNEQPEFVKKNMLTRLRDVFQPSKTRIKEPAIQKNSRGRPSLKKQQKNELMLQVKLPEDVAIQPRQNLLEIPDMFHPYISHIQNVAGDGNCGFRAVAVSLGYDEDQWLYIRKQLLDELHNKYEVYANVFSYGIEELETSLSFFQTNAPREHLMTMPLTGFQIANRFGVIVIFLTKRGSITIFPLWKGPEEFPYHQMITISLVYDNHYVMVQLERDFPMPTIPSYLRRHKNSCVPRWEAVYKSRLELYQQLKPRDREPTFISIEYC